MIALQHTTTQAANIAVIANQCLLEGGEGVLLARVMANLIDPDAAFDDDRNCQPANQLRSLPTNLAEGILIAAPNPTRGYEVTLYINGDIPQGDATVYISNATGIEVQREICQFTNKQATIALQKLPQGSYVCTVQFANGRRISTLIQILY